MKRLPIIRHVRYVYLRWQMNKHYEAWARLGYLPVNVHHDYAVLDKIWHGEA